MMEEELSWLVPAKAEELSVVIMGDLRLLGTLKQMVYKKGVLSPPGAPEQPKDGATRTFLYNAFPIGAAVARTQEMGTINVPALGFLHWCVYEPVRQIDLSHSSYAKYDVKDQSKSAQERFVAAYAAMVAKCVEMHKPKTGLIVTPSMAKVEAMAEQAGGPSNLVSILQGKEPER